MFKFKIAKLEDVKEEHRQFYRQGDDGAFYLIVEGAVAKEKLDEFRDKNVDLLKQMDKFKDVDPVKYKELAEEHRKLEEGELIKKGDVEGLVASRTRAMKEEYDKKYGDLEKSFNTANRQLETLIIDNSVRAEATKLGIAPTAVDDVLLRAKTIYKVEEGKAVAKDAEGKVIYGKDGQNSLAITDWIGSLKESAPHLFQTSQGSGSQHQGFRGGVDTKDMSPSQKIAAGLAKGTSSVLT